MAQKILPNQFDLQGEGVQINYSTTSISGKPLLAFTKGRKTINFSGDDIRRSDTAIGALVTVTIATAPDKSSTTFSLLLPAIELAKESSKQSFRAIGITTTHKTTIAGPAPGVQQTYKVIQMRGSAQLVRS